MSSVKTITSCSMHSSAISSISARVNTLPVGLCGVLSTRPARPWRERSAQLVGVESPIGLVERDEARHGAGEDRVRAVVLVERLEDHDLVARVQEREHRRDHSLGRAAGHRDVGLRVDRPVGIEPLRLGTDGVAEVLGAPRDCVLVDVVVNRSAGGFLELGRTGEVGEALGEVDRVVLLGDAGHLADDRLGELGGLVGNAARGLSSHRG